MEHFELCFQIPTIKMLWLLLSLNLDLEIIRHTEIIIENY